jgi:hypothetical protein
VTKLMTPSMKEILFGLSPQTRWSSSAIQVSIERTGNKAFLVKFRRLTSLEVSERLPVPRGLQQKIMTLGCRYS